MNYLLTLGLLFALGSCSKETSVENEELTPANLRSRVNQEQEEMQEVFAIDLHQSYILGQIAKLNQQKRELEEAIEGGDENQISVLESVMEQINRNTEILKGILENTCAYLKIRKMALLIRVLNGDESADAELQQVKEKLEECGQSTEDYVDKQKISIYALYAPRPKDLDVCIPDKGEFSCSIELNAGNLFVNKIDLEESGSEIYFTTTNGEVISEGESFGSHSELEGVEQTVLELSEMEIGILEFADKKAPFRQPVQVQ